MVTAIIASLLIGSVFILSLTSFQRANAQDALSNKAQEAFNSNNRLPDNTNQDQEQQSTTSNAQESKGQQFTNQINRQGELEDNNANQVQGQQQQSNQGEEDEDKGKGKAKGKNKHNAEEDFVPIATSGNNVYIVWPSNKTTADFEIMFKASTDGGKTFGPKINLSNSTGIDSERPQISAVGSNVFVSWWERNQTSNEPVLRVSNDNGKTFGERIMLSNK
jgi:hypothetical protein